MKCITLSFHINDVGVGGLGHLTYSDPSQTYAHLLGLKSQFGASELFYLSTCNRVEFTFLFESSIPEDFSGLSPFQPRVFWGSSAVTRHLLEVALSKDSLVFGESQILGQFKDAFQRAQETELIGPKLIRLLSLVLREAKRLRTELRLSGCHTSVSTVAAKYILTTLENGADSKKPLLLVGAGETHQILGRYLSKRGVQNLIWINRTPENAERAAKLCGGRTLPWSALIQGNLPEAHAMSFATSAGKVLLGLKALQSSKPRLVLDLSVPANAERHLIESQGATYWGFEDMNTRLKLESKRSTELLAEMNQAIEVAIVRIISDLQLRQFSDVFSECVRAGESVHRELISEGLPNALKGLPEEARSSLEKWSRHLMQRILHQHLEIFKKLSLTHAQPFLEELDDDHDRNSRQ